MRKNLLKIYYKKMKEYDLIYYIGILGSMILRIRLICEIYSIYNYIYYICQ